MKKYFNYGLFLLAIFVGIVSCDSIENNDKESPKIDSISLNSNIRSVGDTLFIGYRFTDNQYLSVYMVSIDDIEGEFYDPSKVIYTKKVIKSFNNNENVYASRRDTIVIPEAMQPPKGSGRLPVADGKYLITISCLDKEGNEAKIELADTLVLNPAKEVE